MVFSSWKLFGFLIFFDLLNFSSHGESEFGFVGVGFLGSTTSHSHVSNATNPDINFYGLLTFFFFFYLSS